MACFEWVSARALPEQWDLRARGWDMVVPGRQPAVRLIGGEDIARRQRPEASAVVLGVRDTEARAQCLAMGFGDALSPETGLDELHWRASSLAERSAERGPLHDRLRFDPLRRDAWVDGRRLHLHPREFLLLWRLAAASGRTVGRETLLRDVFDLGFDPGTNRLAVHVCRLRKKLAHAGVASLLVTGAGGEGYALVLAGAPARIALDDGLDPGEDAFALEEAAE